MNNCHTTFLGRNSYKWWQKKTTIEFTVQSSMLLIWLLIAVELGIFIFIDINHDKLPNVCIFI
jgi:hypothetical protein